MLIRPPLSFIHRSALHSKLATVIGPTIPPLIHKTLPDYWRDDILPSHDAKLALVSKHEISDGSQPLRWTFSQFDQQINWLVNGLIQLGIRKGDRVGVYSQNNSAYATLQWATAKLGAILTTINPAYRPMELRNAISKVNCKVLFCTTTIRKTDTIEMLKEIDLGSTLRSVVLFDNDGSRSIDSLSSTLRQSRYESVVDYRELLVRDDRRSREKVEVLDPHDVINLQFTSGTTGLPKASALTHSNLLNNAFQMGVRMGIKPDDRVCNVPPLFHVFGLVIGNLTSWVHGASVIYPSEGFDPRAVLRTVHAERCTVLHGVPTMFIAELAKLDDMGPSIDLSSLRTGVAAGAPVPKELMKGLEEKMNLDRLTILYGMTETSPASFQTEHDDPSPKRKASVGKVHPHVRSKIVDQDGKTVKCGETGEILVSGYVLHKGYWEDEIEDKKSKVEDIENGCVWIKTGDLGRIDEEGYLEIVGRSKDLIIRGGENIYPLQIENCLIEIDGIVDCSVVGVPDDFFGETVGAFIKTSRPLTTRQICDAIETRLSHQNIPSWIWFLGTKGEFEDDEFPMTASGKIRKVDLRSIAIELSRKGVGRVDCLRKKTE